MSEPKYDWTWVIKNSYDPATQSLKTTQVTGVAYAFEISKNDGDSVYSYREQAQASVTGINNSVSGVIIPAFSIADLSQVCLYLNSTTSVSGNVAVRLEISPVDSGNLWGVFLSQAPATTGVTGTAITEIMARRMRVSLSEAPASGEFDLYLLLRA